MVMIFRTISPVLFVQFIDFGAAALVLQQAMLYCVWGLAAAPHLPPPCRKAGIILTLSQLDYFISVGETLSVSQTAKKVFVSQSAVSKQIILLEKELGVALFERIGNSLELTDAGQKLLDCLQRCTTDFRTTYSTILSQNAAQVSLAFTASINIGQVLLEIAAELRNTEYLQLVIEALNYQNQISSKTDLIITYEDIRLPAKMQSIPLYDVHKYIAYSKDDPFYQKPDLVPADFNQRTMFTGSMHRENFRQQMALCKRLGLTPQVSSRGNTTSLLLATISEHGFCIIDDLCKEIHTPGLALLPINESVKIIIAHYENASQHTRETAEKVAALLRRWYVQTYAHKWQAAEMQ